MARKTNHRFEKRKREKIRAERAQARRQRKQERSAAGASETSIQNHGEEDPDLAGIVVGMQPKDEVSDEEARRAIERAMNPGKALAGDGQKIVRCSKVFVGNLDFGVQEDELRALFTSAGFAVEEAAVIKDRDTGQPRGFAFVELQGLKEAARAATQLDGTELAGRSLRISVADKPQR